MRGRFRLTLLTALLLSGVFIMLWQRNGKANASWVLDGVYPWGAPPSYVTVEKQPDGSWRYIVNGEPQVFIGMGYNPIYRYLSDEQREANYRRDFRILCEAGVNHITGWDFDAGVEQDRFDKLTLDTANQYGLGVIMPMFLPKDADYRDERLTEKLMEQARAKIERYKDHPALRMWGVGNEVLLAMPSSMYGPFGRFYLKLADLFHELDPNHPVIYRENEDQFLPAISRVLAEGRRPWILYGMNVYSLRLEELLDDWPSYNLDRPLFISEFGAEPEWTGGRAMGYVDMWRIIRAHSEYVLGGAPYVWTTSGPEPVDEKWGLMDMQAKPVDDTFNQLAQEWHRIVPPGSRNCSGAAR